MIEEEAIVTRIQGGKIWIKGGYKPSCGGCEQKTSCGTPLFEKLLNRNNVAIEAISSIAVRSGDQVIVGIDETAVLHSSFKVYMIPLIALFLFGLTGKNLGDYLNIEEAELMSIGFALTGLVLSIIYLKNRFNQDVEEQSLKPEILRKC